MTPAPPFLLSIRQASRQCGVARTVLRRMIEAGQVPYHKIDRRIMVDPMVVEHVLSRVR